MNASYARDENVSMEESGDESGDEDGAPDGGRQGQAAHDGTQSQVEVGDWNLGQGTGGAIGLGRKCVLMGGKLPIDGKELVVLQGPRRRGVLL
ncbi:hypothetical protein GOP47_0021099 [Adiantum capillus-veneris]|uniref:Uncharacterized protein n=1 Tax=Adiantum capillus-veneris TaxID=13818 RepID=A0A9D4UAF7_ADICA|nr:hypothetical protein GOP47_0021099 [Adiantum capillus-veneris]